MAEISMFYHKYDREMFVLSKKDILYQIMVKSEVDMVLITDPYSLRYYTGFRGGEGIALSTTGRYVLITDSRYTEAACKESDFTVIEYNQEKPLFDIINEIISEDNVTRLGIEDHSMVYADFHKFRQNLKNIKLWIALDNALVIPRRIKTKEEIGLLRTAESIGDNAFEDICGILKPGMTELEVAAELEYSMKKHGAEGLSFDTIAASGINSSMPHAIPSEKKLENGDFITMDFGCKYHGYCSDMTRTVSIGKASDEQKNIYSIVLEANMLVQDKIHAGMTGREADALARNFIADGDLENVLDTDLDILLGFTFMKAHILICMRQMFFHRE